MKKILVILLVIATIAVIGYNFGISDRKKRSFKRGLKLKLRERNYEKEVEKLNKEYIEPVKAKKVELEERLKKEKEIVDKYFNILKGEEKGDIYAHMKTIEDMAKDIETPEEKKLIYPVLIDINMRNDRFDKVEKYRGELKELGVELEGNNYRINRGGKR
ncbi:MAG: hypothetical protein ACQERZ_06140 [Fusobacteriota bacterium]